MANSAAENLKVYYGIETNNRYLIFILPKSSDNSDFITKLNSNYCTYIFFYISTNEFSNKNIEKIFNLDFNEALLDEK